MENIRKLDLSSREVLERETGFFLGKKSVLVTYHPATLDSGSPKDQFQELAAALDSFDDLKVMFTKANADSGGRVINDLIDDYVIRNHERAIVFTSMGQFGYLSAMKHVNAVVGNSSSGIIEAPTLKTPTVNIGDRQAGRVRTESVIDCIPKRDSITQALQKALSADFGNRVKDVKSPYEKANTVSTIKKIIKTFELKGILKKKFYDLPETTLIQ